MKRNKRSWCDSYSDLQKAEVPRKIQRIGSSLQDERSSVPSELHPHEYLIERLAEKNGCTVKALPCEEIYDNNGERFFREPSAEEIEAYTVEITDAIRNGDIGLLRQIHKEGQPLKCSNRFGESLLHLACRRQLIPVVDFLINEAKVELNVRDDYGRTALHDAMWTPSPNFKLVDLILNECPDLLYVKDKRGHTPLFYARQTHWQKWIDHLEPRLETLIPKSSSFLVKEKS